MTENQRAGTKNEGVGMENQEAGEVERGERLRWRRWWEEEKKRTEFWV